MVTEYDFNTTPEAAYFPSRNRIVAGMSQAVIVIEAAKEGGALITAELANSYQREVFAVPGNIGNKYSEGCNALIATHKAAIFTDPWALADSLGWQLKGTETKKTLLEEPPGLLENEKKVFDLLKSTKEIQIDPLAWKSQMNINELALVLLGLELKGIVKVLPGKKYTLC
jgi:DNA processing protein